MSTLSGMGRNAEMEKKRSEKQKKGVPEVKKTQFLAGGSG